MDRLTSKDECGKNVISTRDEWSYSVCGCRLTLYGCIADRLAAYEDTRLAPEEITALVADNKRLHELVSIIESTIRKGGGTDEQYE